ncbi:MAG: DUF2871 family protein [Anaerolineae bacterium]|jgi:nitric oxide reductase large subunit|nr:DUF2871 family protein [Anaerolineae bacterium]
MNKKMKQHIWMIFRFSLVMVIVGLVLGVYGREITRPLEKVMELDQRLWAQNWIMMTHGHALFHGAVVPMMLAAVTYIFREDLAKDENVLRTLKKAFVVYMVGSVLMLILSVYKGTTYVLTIAGNPALTLEMVDETLFGGSIMLRSILFTIVHPLYATGLVWYLLRVRKSLRLGK